MEKRDVQYANLAQKIESLIIPICRCRQENNEIPSDDFFKNYLNHDLNKQRLEAITLIYEYMNKSHYWKQRMDNIEFINVFNNCLLKYEDIGKSFLNFFIKGYRTRTQDANKYIMADKNKNYVDEKASLFANKNIESDDVPIYDEAANSNNNLYLSDGQVVKNKQIKDNLFTIHNVYDYALKKLNKEELNYLRYYITSQLLVLYSDVQNSFAVIEQAEWGDDITILFSKRITDKKLFPFIDLEFFYEEKEKTDLYLREFQQKKASSGKNMQEKAFLKERYRDAIAKKIGMKSNRMRTKENRRLSFMSELENILHFGTM